jgi:hypothetical protein
MSPVLFVGKDSPEKTGDVVRSLGEVSSVGQDALVKTHTAGRGNKGIMKREAVRKNVRS